MEAEGYGLLTPTDAEVIERLLARLAARAGEEPLRLLEIGIHGGKTSRGIARYLEGLAVPFEYWAVDSGKEARDSPFPECRMVWGDSAEMFVQVPDGLHFVLIDGCHCVNHVILDFCHYGARVTPHGLVVFHDTSPRAQNQQDYQGHGPKELVQFGSAVREGMEKLGLLGGQRTDWRLVEEAWDDDNWGGVSVFERVA